MSLDTFLSKHFTKENHNYTKIKNASYNVTGGTYGVPLDKLDDFYNIYKKHVFIQKKEAYLTEKQLELGPILLDLDFRYDPEVIERQHTEEQINVLLEKMIDIVSMIRTPKDCEAKCFVFEKPNVNTSSDTVTKDGIHIVINIQLDFIEKIILRNKLLSIIGDIFEGLPIINTWSDVIDEGVMKGVVNWQLYGSRKPGYEAYQLKYCILSNFSNNEWSFNHIDCSNDRFVMDNFEDLIARNRKLNVFKQSPSIIPEYTLLKESRNTKSTSKVKSLGKKIPEHEPYLISCEAELDGYINDYYNITQDTESICSIKDTHEYAMILTEEYYNPGSYTKWIQLGMALRICNYKLFASWVKVSSKSPTFEYNSIRNMYDQWNHFSSEKGLTVRSIIYWAKTCNKNKYEQINKNTISSYIHYSFNNQTDYDIANTLYNCYSDKFICTNIKKDIWFKFDKHRWCVNDSAVTLKNNLSTHFHDKYKTYFNEQDKSVLEDEKKKKLITDFEKISDKLKTHSNKSNIIKEANEIFFDDDFYTYLDSNPYFIGCSNGIIDIKNKVCRDGTRSDYIGTSTNIHYIPLETYKETKPHVIQEITTFFEQLFPNEELRSYMWEHLASTLMGTNDNQTFNIYTGSGSNGKSKLVDLMTKTLGEYKGVVPITLITQKRNSIGSTSPEVAKLFGKRYAVMQEPSKGDVINEGIMKELTGGDTVQCRALYKDCLEYVPQFKLVVCTNTLFGIKSNDDGTWRRIRVCEFNSKFTDRPNTPENPNNNNEFPLEDYPHQFMIDPSIDSKFEYWAPVLFSMLVDIVYTTQGRVKDVPCVIEPTNQYRERQDPLLEFTRSSIKVEPEDNNMPPLQISVIKDAFKQWCYNQYGTDKPLATTKELTEYITKKFGRPTKKGWRTISLITEGC